MILDDAILHRVADDDSLDDEARDEEKENVILDMSQRMNDNVDFDSSAIVGEDMFVKGMNVRILKGASEGKHGTISRLTEKCAFISIEGMGKDVRKTKSFEFIQILDDYGNVVVQEQHNSMVKKEDEQWCIPDAKLGGTRYGSRIVTKITLMTESDYVPDTFLDHYLGHRKKVIDIHLNAKETSTPVDITYERDGSRYELVSAKVVKEEGKFKGKFVRLVYCQVSGPMLEELDLSALLESIGDFGRLSPRKATARLELLQSPVLRCYNGQKRERGIFFISSSLACVVPDNGNDGCGYIADYYLDQLLGDLTYAKDTIAIQVRLFIPRLGIFKGMLMRKRIVNGAPIELQPSMHKVPASALTNASSDKACLVICQAGRHPTQLNKYIGQWLNPELKSPPEISFQNLIKPLDKRGKKKGKKDKTEDEDGSFRDMIPRILRGLGVPDDVCDDYVKKSKRIKGLNHSYIVGVADPTNALPPDKVFVTGFSNVALPPGNKIFVTRSPCVKASDAHMIPLVTEKPGGMSQEDWNWLQALPFGGIIFGNPDPGIQPLPVQIANGDLDGDLYFMCWNAELLSYITTDSIAQVELEDDVSANEAQPNENWLANAQKMMVDSIALENDFGKLTGKLYNLAQELADKSSLFMRDPDVAAFAHAFNCALDYKKHGGRVALPAHLHHLLPEKLRKYLVKS